MSGGIIKKGKRFGFLEQNLYLQQAFAGTTAFHNSFSHLAPLRPNTHKGEVAAYTTKKKRWDHLILINRPMDVCSCLVLPKESYSNWESDELHCPSFVPLKDTHLLQSPSLSLTKES